MTGPEQSLGELTCNDFLGGRVRIFQPKTGYRAGIDPVMLAASVPAKPGQSLLDLGCGAGVAALCVGARVPNLSLTGLEIQPAYADLARRNAAQNALDLEVIEGNLLHMPETLRAQQFDHVIANPPFFDRRRSSPSSDAGRETAMGESAPLESWAREAAKRCAPGGYVSVIHRAECTDRLLQAMNSALGSVEILPLVPRRGKPARLVIVRAKKGGRAALKLHDGWVLHAGESHVSDGDDYTGATSAILRDASALPFP